MLDLALTGGLLAGREERVPASPPHPLVVNGLSEFYSRLCGTETPAERQKTPMEGSLSTRTPVTRPPPLVLDKDVRSSGHVKIVLDNQQTLKWGDVLF